MMLECKLTSPNTADWSYLQYSRELLTSAPFPCAVPDSLLRLMEIPALRLSSLFQLLSYLDLPDFSFILAIGLQSVIFYFILFYNYIKRCKITYTSTICISLNQAVFVIIHYSFL